LIKWSNSIDKVFSEKLQRRLNQTVLKKWNLTQKVKEKDQKNIEDFKHMALNERLIAIRKTGLHILNKLGYSSWKLITGESFSHSQSQLSYEKMHEHSWGFSSFRSKQTLSVASFIAEDSLTLKFLRDEFSCKFLQSKVRSKVRLGFFESIFTPHFNAREMIQEAKPIIESIEHHVLCSIKAIPQSKIMSVMPSLCWDRNLQCYRTQLNWYYTGYHQRNEKTISVFRELFLYVISDITSIADFNIKIKDIEEKIKKNQQKKITDGGLFLKG
jgi:hypothetical protein